MIIAGYIAAVIASISALLGIYGIRGRAAQPPRCKEWVSLLFEEFYPEGGYRPALQCCLPAGHPRGKHLLDPDELRELNMYVAPF